MRDPYRGYVAGPQRPTESEPSGLKWAKSTEGLRTPLTALAGAKSEPHISQPHESKVLPHPQLAPSPYHLQTMNPVVCAFLLAVSQAVAVAAKGKKSGTKSGSKRKVSIPLIAGIIVAVVVGTCTSYYRSRPFFLTRFFGYQL